uniref:Reverse transcriptase Ty1/copia-type domain-containing protein n=1 Tax=Fagus sylvatica TaxID=28930 RepID=A0A2N9FXB0_FAGSY
MVGSIMAELDLYELEEDEGTLSSLSEGGRLVPRPVIAEDSHIPRRHFEIERNVILCDAKDVDESSSFNEALHSPDRDEWMTAMQKKMSSMDKNNVWEVQRKPRGEKAIPNEWDLELFQMDVKTAFFNGELDEEIYMAQPVGFEVQGHKHKVLHLKRFIYGLKQSSRPWYLRFYGSITSFGFEMIEEDHCMYLKHSKRSILILSLYVDDILLAGNDMDSIVTTKKWLSSNFEMKDMGEANFVLGLAWLVVIRAILDLLIGKQVKRILWYLCGTIDHALCYHGGDLRLIGYNDADWASDKDERKSTSSATAHAEDVVLLYSDGTSALAYAKDPKYHGKAKHIELRYHYI